MGNCPNSSYDITVMSKAILSSYKKYLWNFISNNALIIIDMTNEQKLNNELMSIIFF